jgi:ATP-dependent Clp protease ATP-binding subunit ClpA
VRQGASPFRDVVVAALEEARRRGDRRLGTDHLLLGLLHDADSEPARALGVDLIAARLALDSLDRRALRALGIDVDAVADRGPLKHPPVPLSAVTSTARAVLARGVRATTAGTRARAPRHLLLALLDRARPDPAAELLAELGVDAESVRAHLAA